MSRFLSILMLLFAGCTSAQERTTPAEPIPAPSVAAIANHGRVVHVLVALCDNEHQGIVPVPEHLGNGEDPDGNLYWGAAFGVRTHFSKSRNWQLVEKIAAPDGNVIERVIFRHRSEKVHLVADAYRGSRMRQTIDAFFDSLSGAARENVKVGGVTIQIKAGSDLVAFVGHDGLMDFELGRKIERADAATRDAVVLACASRNYFFHPMKATGARPLLWTTNLMAPEAYTLHDALDGWVANESPEQIRERAAKAYSRYQKLSLAAAKRLLVTGF